MASFVPAPQTSKNSSEEELKSKLKKTPKRFEGTYKQIPKVPWTELLVNHFGNPDWVSLYPIQEGTLREDAEGQMWGTPKGLLPPRTACKLFHDGVYILNKSEESVKFMQDRIPEMCHKQFKKKQWRKQFFEACRRVCCRLSIGLGFKPNCVAEDVFIHAILNMSFELGWNRIKEHLAGIPMTDRDRDFNRVHKLAANEEILALTKGAEAAASASKKTTFKLDVKTADPKQWFKCYEPKLSTMFDHVVEVHPDDTDAWSVSTGSTLSTASASTSPSRRDKMRSESLGSAASDGEVPNFVLPSIDEEPKLGGQKLSASNLAALAEQLGARSNS
jgi:hypothetical protein